MRLLIPQLLNVRWELRPLVKVCNICFIQWWTTGTPAERGWVSTVMGQVISLESWWASFEDRYLAIFPIAPIVYSECCVIAVIHQGDFNRFPASDDLWIAFKRWIRKIIETYRDFRVLCSLIDSCSNCHKFESLNSGKVLWLRLLFTHRFHLNQSPTCCELKVGHFRKLV
jgi:hypothetical protein